MLAVATEIPSAYSPLSAFCLVGIAIMTFLIGGMLTKGWKFWFTGMGILSIGMLYIWGTYQSAGRIQSTTVGSGGDPSYETVVEYKGEWTKERDLLRENKFYNDDKRVLSMHVEGTNPWVWHPMCLITAPFFACLIGFFAWLLGARSTKFRREIG